MEYAITALASSLATFTFSYLIVIQRLTRIETKLEMHLKEHEG